jgi:CheY-like chemotaxis protein
MTAHRRTGSLRADKSSSRAVILVVDDDDETRETLALVLEELGYRVLQAGSGASALEVAEHMADELDLLVTDVRMPGMNGVQLAKQVNDQFPQIPVLFVSGYAAGALVDDAEGSAPRGAFLPKPFSIDALDTYVRQALARPEGR